MSLAANGSAREPDLHAQAVFIIVMGVSGTGKSTLGRALAGALGMPYVEGDDLHPAANVTKMSAGIPLTDADREPWLALIRATAERTMLDRRDRNRNRNRGRDRDRDCDCDCERERDEDATGTKAGGVVISCSALKRYYRDILRGKRTVGNVEGSWRQSELRTYFVFIEGPREVLLDRMEKRPGHFMKASMLDSQLNTLESPVGEEDVVVVSLEDCTEEQVKIAMEGLGKLAGDDSIVVESQTSSSQEDTNEA